MLWSNDGRQLGREVVNLAGKIKAAQVFGDRLLIATTGEIVEIDVTSLLKARSRAFSFTETPTTLYRTSPGGVWVIGDGEISFFDLSGRPPATKARPLVASDKPRCPPNAGDVKQPCSRGLQLDQTEALVSDTGDIFLSEVIGELYPYEGLRSSRQRVAVDSCDSGHEVCRGSSAIHIPHEDEVGVVVVRGEEPPIFRQGYHDGEA